MHLISLQQQLRPAPETGWGALVPVATILISGLVIILEISPAYLQELHPLTLLLLSVASALPMWALNQLLWWQIGRSVSGAIVGKLTYVLDVSEKHRRAYSYALAELLKAVDVLRFLPYKNLANLTTVIAIYAGAALAYTMSFPAEYLYGCIVGLSLMAWLIGLLSLRRAIGRIDVEPLHGLWLQLKDNDELLATINAHFERLEALLLAAVGRGRTDP